MSILLVLGAPAELMMLVAVVAWTYKSFWGKE